MSNVLISIIIPIYNSGKYLNETLDSILNQDINDVEIICIDDGSDDNSLEILKIYEKTFGIIVMHQENMGAPAARNLGLNNSSGEYIWFFDSDDLMIEGTLQFVKECIKQFDSDLFITNFISFKGSKILLRYNNSNQILYTKKDKLLYAYLRPAFPGNKIYKKEIIKNNNISFSNLKIGQDLSFYIKYLYFARNIKYLRKDTTKYRITEGSISTSYDKRILNILDCFNDIDTFYNNKSGIDYGRILNIVYYSNLVYQLSKTKNVVDSNLRTEIREVLLEEIKKNRKMIHVCSPYEIVKVFLIDSGYRRIIKDFS